MAFDLNDERIQLILDSLDKEERVIDRDEVRVPERNLNNVVQYEENQRNTFIEARTSRRRIDGSEFKKLFSTEFEEL